MADDRYDTIPEPSEDPQSLLNTAKALKQTVERLIGNDGPARTFAQRETPQNAKIGDRWTKLPAFPGDMMTESVWTGQEWLTVNTDNYYFDYPKADVLLNNTTIRIQVLITPPLGLEGQIWRVEPKVLVTDTTAAATFDAAINVIDRLGTTANVGYDAKNNSSHPNNACTLFPTCVVTLRGPTRFQLDARDYSFSSGRVFGHPTAQYTSLFAYRLR